MRPLERVLRIGEVLAKYAEGQALPEPPFCMLEQPLGKVGPMQLVREAETISQESGGQGASAELVASTPAI